MYIEIGTIVTIILLAVFVIWGIKDHLNNKEIERKREEEERLKKEKSALWLKNQEEKEQLKKEYQIKEIVAIMNCSFEQAKTYWQAMSDFILLSDFDSGEIVADKKIIIKEAIE